MKYHAELNVMIAEETNRGHGFGSEIIMQIMNYSYENIDDLISFFVKINETNEKSIKIFEKLGFIKYEYIKAFKQISMKYIINNKPFPCLTSDYVKKYHI